MVCAQYYSFLSIYLFKSAIVLFWKTTLSILIGIRLPLLPVTILYSLLTPFFPNLCNYHRFYPLEIENILSYHIKIFCSCLCIITALTGLIDSSMSFSATLFLCWSAGTSAHLLKVVAVSTFVQFFPNARHLWGSCMAAQHVHLFLGLLFLFLGIIVAS